MAEYTNAPIQEVASAANVLFTNRTVDGCDLIRHRDGSGVIKVFPVPGKCFTRYKVSFYGNIAVPTGQTVGAISVAIAIDGEADNTTIATITPAAVDEYGNVATSTYVYVRHGCCSTVSIKNINAIPINVSNANIIVTKE